MPSLHQLWKTFQTHTETQNRLRSVFARSLFNSKPAFSYTSGEPARQFEFSGSSYKLSEVANLSRPLSIPQAASRVLATPSVHGPVCHSFYSNPCQVLLDKSQPGRSKQSLGWTLTSSLHGIVNGPHPKLEARLHVCSLDSPSGASTSAVGVVDCWGHQNNLFLNKEASESSGVNHVWSHDFSVPIWSFDVRGSSDNKGPSHNKAVQNEKMTTQWPLGTSVAFHLMRYGLCLLPAVQESLQRSVHGFDAGASLHLQPASVLDCATDRGNAEISENHSEGTLSSSGLRLLSAACCLPHPEKQDTGGEDAYFICSDKQVIGVADGVGGWADMGVDAGEYARQLMNESLLAAQQEPAGCIDTARVMEIAHSKTTCRGSSTACILALSNYGLQAANLGDSGFLVVRNGRLVFKSPAQQHNFNVPFQLENGGGDPPNAAEVFTVEVAAGDVVVAGTDGLFDNLYDTELVSIVVRASRAGLSPDITAKTIAALARERAQDCNRQTPFSTAAQDAGFRFYGGKMDDITVIVSYVVK
eukprot:c2848_g1_i1 orf=363-1949(-)